MQKKHSGSSKVQLSCRLREVGVLRCEEFYEELLQNATLITEASPCSFCMVAAAFFVVLQKGMNNILSCLLVRHAQIFTY